MLAEALAAEVDAYIAAFAAERDESGRRIEHDTIEDHVEPTSERVIFGETSSTGARPLPAISAYARASTWTSRYITFARLALAGKPSTSAL